MKVDDRRDIVWAKDTVPGEVYRDCETKRYLIRVQVPHFDLPFINLDTGELMVFVPGAGMIAKPRAIMLPDGIGYE